MSEETQVESSSADSKVKAPARIKKTKEPKEAKEYKEPKKVSLKKLDPDSTKLLVSLREKANKKELGRKIRDSEIIHLGLTLIEVHHLEALKEATYSEQDRLKMVYLEYQKEHGRLTLDQFIGKLIRGEIQSGIQN